MLQFLVRRLLLVLPVLVGILFVTFAITRMVPGDPCFVMLGEKATVESCKDFNVRFGLDKSIPEQFVRYVANIAQGDFGNSLKDHRPITTVISERLPMTIELTILAMLFSSTIGTWLALFLWLKAIGLPGHPAVIAALGSLSPFYASIYEHTKSRSLPNRYFFCALLCMLLGIVLIVLTK